jgi:hypothetical protein
MITSSAQQGYFASGMITATLVFLIVSSGFSGPPAVRELRPVQAVAGKDVELICPIGGLPLTIIGWRKGEQYFIKTFYA